MTCGTVISIGCFLLTFLGCEPQRRPTEGAINQGSIVHQANR